MVGGFEQDVHVQDTWKWECIRCIVKREALKTAEEGWAWREILKKKCAWVRPNCQAVLAWITCFPESGLLAKGLQVRLELGEERAWALTTLQARLVCKAPVFLTSGRGCFLFSYRGLTDYRKRQFLLNSSTSTKKYQFLIISLNWYWVHRWAYFSFLFFNDLLLSEKNGNKPF